MSSAGLLSSTPLIGREAELAALRAQIARYPLVTLTGPGGTGKTRLAFAALDALTDDFPDGVALCPLVPVSDPAAVRTTVATKMGLLLGEADDFGGALGGGRVLVVLDNCEHVLSGVREVTAELLAAGPHIRVVATSRESLALPGERLFPVGPLTVVDGSPEAISATPAARLFTERAQAVWPAFHVDESNAASLAELCRRLDGLPLALELAAARIRSMTPGEMLLRISAGAALEAPAKTSTPERHRSLHSVVEWSYRLLDQRSRRVFERMSVMAGGCLLEAAEAVCSGEGVPPEQVFDLLDGLVDRSLLYTTHRNGRTRYVQLQTLRPYATERLQARGESLLAAGSHADYFASVCDGIWRQLHEHVADHDTALLSAELNNVARALRFCLAHDEEPGRAYRLTAGLWLLAFGPDAPTVASLAAEVVTTWPPEGNSHPLGPDVAGVAAGASLALDQAADARRYAEQAIAAAAPDRVPPMWARRVLGEVLTWYEGQPAEGLAVLDDALADALEARRRTCVLEVEHVRLLTLPELGEYDAALVLARQVARESPGTFEGAYARMAEVLLVARVDLRAAESLLPPLLASSGEFAGLGRLLLHLTEGSLAMLRGREREAASHFVTALALSLRRGVRRFWASQVGSVLPLVAQHRPDVARELWGAVLAADRRVIQLETVGLPVTLESLGPVEPLAMPSQRALELASTTLRALEEPAHRAGEAAPGAQEEPPEQPPPGPGRATGELVRSAGVWTFTWRGRRTHLPDLKGLADLAALLQRPGVDVHVLDLYGAGDPERRPASAEDVGGPEGGLGEAIDGTARAAYRQRIRDLQEEIEDAEASGDNARVEHASTELDALVTHLAGAYGLAGRQREVGHPTERARSAVAWRLRSALRRVASADPELGRHLAASVQMGTWCRYEPPEPVAWSVSS